MIKITNGVSRLFLSPFDSRVYLKMSQGLRVSITPDGTFYGLLGTTGFGVVPYVTGHSSHIGSFLVNLRRYRRIFWLLSLEVSESSVSRSPLPGFVEDRESEPSTRPSVHSTFRRTNTVGSFESRNFNTFKISSTETEKGHNHSLRYPKTNYTL